jgi:hypothetical protein
MFPPLYVVFAAGTVASSLNQTPCVPSGAAPSLDHVVVAVHDLDGAANKFRALGFRIKPGRLHPNGLLNRHLKFRDGSSVELMSLAGRPGDEMAADYAALLEQGDAAVYLAIRVTDSALPIRAATALRLETRRSSSGELDFLSFPPSSPAAAVFFVWGGTPVADPDSLTSHDPDVSGLDEVWLEGGVALTDLLARTGARPCGSAHSRHGDRGERWALDRGSLVVVPPRSGERARVLGIILRSEQSVRRTFNPLGSVWIEYRQ